MKKLFTIVSIVALSITFTSCDLWDALMLKWMENMEERANEEYTAEMISAGEIEILYSNAYDGYVNIRQAPTTKSAIIGVLRNGEEFVEKIGEDGNWMAVEWENGIGYVHKNMVGTKPWKAFNLNITADQIEGVYYADTGHDGILIDLYCIFSNGRFIHSSYDHSDENSYGKWKFEGTDIVLTTKYVTALGKDAGIRVGQVNKFPIKVRSNKVVGIGNYGKGRKGDIYDFNGQKKQAAQLVK